MKSKEIKCAWKSMQTNELLSKILKTDMDFSINSCRKAFGNRERIFWATLYWDGGFRIFDGKSLKTIEVAIDKFLKSKSK